MNKIMLMGGTILFCYLFFLSIAPSYKETKRKKFYYFDREDYKFRINCLSFIFSLTINLLFWGWIL